MLKDALSPATLDAGVDGFRRFAETRRGKRHTGAAAEGGWYSPWMVRDRDYFPAAAVLHAVIRSWVWDVVEEICGSSHLVVLLKWSTARHSIDKPLSIGAHQDAKLVASRVPFSIWIPLQEVVPLLTSGLGFIVPAPDRLLPTFSHDAVGADYVLSDPARLWIPPYAAGDLTIHSRFAPYFMAGYGTRSDCFSLEIRAMARRKAPPNYLDPALYVSRRDGLPTIVEAKGSADAEAWEFLASADLANAGSRDLRRTLL